VRPIGQFCTLRPVDTEGTEADQNGGSRIVLDSTSPQLNCSGIVNLVHVGI